MKGNRGTLHADVSPYRDDPALEAGGTITSVDAGNGRIETRMATVTTNVDWLLHRHKWWGLVCIGKVTRMRQTKAKTEISYYLLSTAMTAQRFNAVVRRHWRTT